MRFSFDGGAQFAPGKQDKSLYVCNISSELMLKQRVPLIIKQMSYMPVSMLFMVYNKCVC